MLCVTIGCVVHLCLTRSFRGDQKVYPLGVQAAYRGTKALESGLVSGWMHAELIGTLPERALITRVEMLPYGVLEVHTNSGSVWLFDTDRRVWTLLTVPA